MSLEETFTSYPLYLAILCIYLSGVIASAGGIGGGGSGGGTGGVQNGVAGQPNTGAGGGGGSGFGGRGGNGGLGVVIISYPDNFPNLITIHSSHVCNGQAAGGTTAPSPSTARAGYKTYTFTAGSGNISW
jgi:hypothetical protein